MELPVYEIFVDEADGAYVDAIAFVSEPAIEKEFLAFNKEKLKFVYNDEKSELLGPALIPDVEIFRAGKNGDYFVKFSKDTIRQIAQIFFKNNFQKSLNIDHSSTPAESYVFQSFIIDSKNGIKYQDLPDGSWVIGVKVQSKDVWADIKAGKQKGFSVEGFFQLAEIKMSKEDELAEIHDLLKQFNSLKI